MQALLLIAMKDEKKQSLKLQEAIQQHTGKTIDPKTQQTLNTPKSDETSKLSLQDKSFLENLIGKVKSGEINLLQPSSVINQQVYEKLDGPHKAKTEQFIAATLFTLRQIVDFYNNPHSNDSYQMLNLLQGFRFKKETLEKEIGDVLKI